MAIAPAALFGGVALTTSTADLYTAPAGTKAVIKRAVFANYSGSAATFTLTVTRSGGSAFTLVNARSIASGATDLVPELANFVLAAGDKISALASAATSINAFGSGYTA